jgi:hypothetical protein
VPAGGERPWRAGRKQDKPDWTNGFLSLTINKNTRVFFCKTHLIVNGQCKFGGRIYSA